MNNQDYPPYDKQRVRDFAPGTKYFVAKVLGRYRSRGDDQTLEVVVNDGEVLEHKKKVAYCRSPDWRWPLRPDLDSHVPRWRRTPREAVELARQDIVEKLAKLQAERDAIDQWLLDDSQEA